MFFCAIKIFTVEQLTTALHMVLISLREERTGIARMAVPRMLEGAKATRVAALPLQAVAVGTTRWAFITATILTSIK